MWGDLVLSIILNINFDTFYFLQILNTLYKLGPVVLLNIREKGVNKLMIEMK